MNPLDRVRRIADAVLFEGYLLYPYRASAQKNQQRFQFGVLMPHGYTDPSESSSLHLECVFEAPESAELTFVVRFLQLHRRQLNPSEAAWDEAEDHERHFKVPLRTLLDGEFLEAFYAHESDDATRRRWRLDGELHASAVRLPGPYGAMRLHVEVENTTATEPLERREDALRRALISAHVVIHLPDGAFLSMVSPPQWASGYVAECDNTGVWPVLAGPEGDQDLLLASPIILYDHPEVAAESPGDLFDSTEIDEILSLRTLTLTDAEKAEARATDPRAAEIIDRTDALSPQMLDRLHGAIRYLRSPGGRPAPEPEVPWWDPGSDASVSPETDEVVIDGVPVSRGTEVLMRPGNRRADAQDIFLAGRTAVVEAVLHDVDGKVHLAVTPQDDPDAELRGRHGRFLYFAPDEVEPIEAGS